MNWFDICIVIVIIYSVIKGYKTGLVKQLSTLAGLVAAAILSGQLSALILPYILQINQIPDYMASPLSYTVTFAIIMFLFFLLGKMLEEIIKTIKMGLLNKLAGVVLSVAKWLFAISIVINLIAQADEQLQILTPKIEQGSVTYKYIQPIAPTLVPYLKSSFEEELNQTLIP